MSVRFFVLFYLFRIIFAQNSYHINTTYSGTTFFDGFNFDTRDDPTHGCVDYVNRSRAESLGLISFPNGKVKIASDSTNIYPNTTRGRPSIRIESKTQYNSGLFIFDLDHMPVGPGTWPAWWTTNTPWPDMGEIDIIEGIGGNTWNTITLHTRDGCHMRDKDAIYFTGTWAKDANGTINATNCYINAPNQFFNHGCSIQAANGTYGNKFNNNNGGVVAMEWEHNSFIRIFMFQRGQIPSDITQGNPNPSSWGKPVAYFTIGVNCTADHFQLHHVIINLTFCGDWAGNVYPGGPGACENVVRNFPEAFTDAYWLINSLKVYSH